MMSAATTLDAVTVEPAARQANFDIALAALVLLNLFDAVFTAFWVQHGDALEANPVMALVLRFGIGPFIMVKLALIFGGCAVLRTFRDRTLARGGVHAMVVAYALVVAFHLSELHRVIS
jgi:hypothetical protein